MEKIISIDGMHCKSCKSLIESEVSEMTGVDSIVVSLEEKNAKVMLKEDCVNDIVEAINGLGFSAKVH